MYRGFHLGETKTESLLDGKPCGLCNKPSVIKPAIAYNAFSEYIYVYFHKRWN